MNNNGIQAIEAYLDEAYNDFQELKLPSGEPVQPIRVYTLVNSQKHLEQGAMWQLHYSTRNLEDAKRVAEEAAAGGLWFTTIIDKSDTQS